MALTGVAMLFLSQPAVACSWSYERGTSPEEVRQRSDVTAIRATFRFEELRGERGLNSEGEEVVYNPEVVGVVERGATHLETIHYPGRQFEDMTCLFPGTGPVADARGTFWIATRPEHGRYRILYWEGEYLPVAPTESESTD
jgi:hypothetical protein